jgi:putative ABC transport system permease protein
MNVQEHIWNLIAKKLAGEASEKELAELQDLLLKHPDYTYPAQILSDLWKPVEPADKAEVEKAFVEHMFRLADHSVAREPAPSKNRRLFFPLTASSGMFKNHLRTSWRNLTQHKTFSLINIMGLAIGMASAVLILLWIQNEMSVDQFHTKKDRIYEVYNRAVFDGRLECWTRTPQVMGPVLKKDFPQVEEAVRVNWVGAFVLSAGEKHLETQGYLTDPGFLKIFDFPLKAGDPNTALDRAHSIILTENMAQKLFGEEDALGKTVRLDSIANFTVTGVMKKLPNNSKFHFEYLVPWTYMKEAGWFNDKWTDGGASTYVMLRPGVNETTADNLIRTVIQTHMKDAKNEIFLHPMSKWRLYSQFENGKITGGRIELVRLFGMIAGFILLIACINYINLSTARSIRRAKEVGIRKVAGAGRGSLVGQFLGESVLIAFLAAAIALLILQPGLKVFNNLMDEALSVPFQNPDFWMAALGFILFTGIIAGIYPAFYLSAYKPINVLKGHFKATNTLITPRKVLVVFQFSFAIVLIICTIVIYRQIGYAEKRDAGYQKDNLVFVYIKGDIRKNYPKIRQELLSSGAITSLTRTNSPITDIWEGEDSYVWKGKDPASRNFFALFYTDNDFVKTMGLTMLAGRDIDAVDHPEDSTAILLNESAVKLMNFTNPLGQIVKSSQGIWHVLGVVRNFIPGSPFEQVQPMVVQGPKSQLGTVTFRLNAENAVSYDLKRIAEIFHTYNPDYPFDYKFVDESYANKFREEQHTGMLAALFAGLTILISCLGLFALAICMAENRIKEIGVRKVLGASVAAITTLLSKDFLKLVFIAFAIASPVAWYAMNAWLQNYSYRAPISGWVFVVTGIGSLLIAAATVSYQAIKAALASPVKSLRAE